MMTLECDCDERRFGEEKLGCESQPSTYWDTEVCACISKGVVPRGLDARDVYPRDGPCQGGGDMTSMEDMHWYDNMHAIGYISLGCFITVSIFLLAATLYYRKKLHNLKHLKLVSQHKPGQKYKIHENVKRQPSGQINRDRKHQLTNYSNVLYQQDLCNGFDNYHLQQEEDSLGQQRLYGHGGRVGMDGLDF